MAVDTPSISRPIAAPMSTDYEKLFLEGLRHIEALSGKIWTDYNAHDPGITILEVLCFAITELGYRCDFEVGDIIAPNSEDTILNNFFSLANVGSNAPLTISDFRKLLIDMDGNRNAWLEKVVPVTGTLYADLPQVYFKVDDANTAHLDYVAPTNDELTSGSKEIAIKGLYDVYLQFVEHSVFGDLNDNSLALTLMLKPVGQDVAVPFEIEIEFPVWEKIPTEVEALSDYIDTTVASLIFTLECSNLQQSDDEAALYNTTIGISYAGATDPVELPVHVRIVSGLEYVRNEGEFRIRLLEKIHGQTYSDGVVPGAVVQLVLDFLNRRKVIQDLLAKAATRLADQRNLCEDFHALYPMSLQEIGLSLTLEVEPGTNSEEVMAEVYYIAEQYLSPSIRFYSLREMLDKGYTAEEIFRGPWLLNGFIDENDLSFYQHREILYTSDLVQSFMAIKGVKSVKEIAFSRYAEGMVAMNSAGVKQQNLKECLCLENPSRYLPRLNHTRSNILIDGGAGRAIAPNRKRALQLLDERKALDKLKGEAGQGDFEEPVGSALDLESYYSIQNEFPINYAIGIEGLASNETDARKAQAQQLKGYLLFFEQLLANFHSQLSNLRQLFSYDSQVDRSYFTQALYNVPRVKSLINDFTESGNYDGWELEEYMAILQPDSDHYERRLNALAERPEVFQDRRKRFLDHLLGRFNESFSEYAAYVFSRNIPESAQYDRLIEDQARFLRDYVLHSHDRGSAFNYRKYDSANPDENPYWRAALQQESLRLRLAASDDFVLESTADPLEEFEIYQDAQGKYRFRIHDDNGANMFYAAGGYDTEAILREELLLAISWGTDLANYTGTGANVVLLGSGAPLLSSFGIVGAAFIRSYYLPNPVPSGQPTAALSALADYFKQLLTVDQLPVESELGNSVWQDDNDVTGLKKRMVFLTGLPNVNREFINPFEQFEITGSSGAFTFRLWSDFDEVIFESAYTYGTQLEAAQGMLDLILNIDAYDIVLQVGYAELWNNALDPVELVGTITAAQLDATVSLEAAKDDLSAYLQTLYAVENLHVVEHVLLRPRFEDDAVLKVRHDNECAALDICDPYSFRISVVVPNWAGRFAEMEFRSMFKRILRAEAPAHVYVHFLWLDPIQMFKFEHCWANWLNQDWSEGGVAGASDAFVTCFNALCNLEDAYYVIEPANIKDLYENCDLLAAPYDPDGLIIKAWLADDSAALPDGTCLNPCNGEIRVSDKVLLKATEAHEFPLHIFTINAGGEETCHQITLEFVENGSAYVDISTPATDICAFINGSFTNPIFTFLDVNEDDIVQAVPTNYSIKVSNPGWPTTNVGNGPILNGLAIDAITGAIIVDDPLQLVDGDYSIQVMLTDEDGGITSLTVELIINPDKEAIVTTNMPTGKNQDAYALYDVLATITDPDGDLVSVTNASAPTLAALGLEINPPGGTGPSVELRIGNLATFWAALPSLYDLSAGFYSHDLYLNTLDNCLGTTELLIPLLIRQDHEAIFSGVPVKNVSLFTVNASVGTIKDTTDGGLTNARVAAANAILAPYGLVLFMNASFLGGNYFTVKILNRLTFINAINAAPTSPGRIGTLNITVPTQDVTGGESNVVCSISAIKDNIPVITYVDVRNVDTYVYDEIMATISDSDGTGIVSATHVSSGFTLASLGLKLEVSSPYTFTLPYEPATSDSQAQFRNPNLRSVNKGKDLGDNLRSTQFLVGGNFNSVPYQAGTVRNYYTPAIPGKARIKVDSVKKFRQEVANNPVWTVVDPNTHQVKLDITINTVDSYGGIATNIVSLNVLQDIEASVFEVMNGSRIDALSYGSVLFKFLETDPNTPLASATPSVPLPNGLTMMATGTAFSIVVTNAKALAVQQLPLIVDTVDIQGGVSSFEINISILPRLVKLDFVVEASQQSHILDVSTQVAGLQIDEWVGPRLPKVFGTLFLNDGSSLGFTEGSSFGTSTAKYGLSFTGTISQSKIVSTSSKSGAQGQSRTNLRGIGGGLVEDFGTAATEIVEGVLYISRKAIKRSEEASNSVKGLQVLSGNAVINNPAVVTDPKLKELANQTGLVLGKMQEMTFYPDNPVLRTAPGEMEAFANGQLDAEIGVQMKSLSESSVLEIAELQKQVGLGGTSATKARQSIAAHAEVLKMQILSAVQYAGGIRSADIGDSEPLVELFGSYKLQLDQLAVNLDSDLNVELGSLRKSLFELQGQYSEDKPQLDAAIAGLKPKMQHARLSKVELELASKTSGNIDAELLTQLAAWRSVFEAIDTQFEDAEFLKGWQEGVGLDAVLTSFEEPTKALLDYLTTMDEQLAKLSYGATQVELQENYKAGVQMLVAGVNSFFELLDLLPGDEQTMIDMGDWLSGFTGLVKSTANQPGLADFRNLIASWTSKWPVRQSLNSSLNQAFEVAVLDMLPNKPIDHYVAGDVLAELRMITGNLAGVKVTKGLLPFGMKLTDLGQIVIDDPSKLMVGFFSGIVLSGNNDRGFAFSLLVPEIELSFDDEAAYEVLPAMPIEAYLVDMELAWPIDPDGSIVAAQVLPGNFPPGVRFNTETGVFTVARPTRLVAGSYPLTVGTVDERGGKSLLDVTIVLGLDGNSLVNLPPLDLLNVQLPKNAGDRIGIVTLPGGDTIATGTIKTGSLPDGVSYTLGGFIVVDDPNLLFASISNFTLELVGASGLQYQVTITIEFLAPLQVGPTILPNISLLNLQLPLLAGDVIGLVTLPQGDQIDNAVLFSGSLPTGILLTASGRLVVDNPSLLIAGFSTFTIELTGASGLIYRAEVTTEFLAPIQQGPIILSNVSILNLQLPMAVGTVIGQAVLPNGDQIVNAFVLTGVLPSGVLLTTIGRLEIGNANILAPGTVTFTMGLDGSSGATYHVDVTIQFLAASPVVLTPLSFTNLQLPMNTGDIIGAITLPLGRQVLDAQVFTGPLPNGVALTPFGRFDVSNGSLLVAGTKTCTVALQATDGSTYRVNVTFQFIAQAPLGPVTLSPLNIMGIQLPLSNGFVIGRPTLPQGDQIVSTSIVSGALPNGVGFSSNGILSVANSSMLVEGTYSTTFSLRGSSGTQYQLNVTIELLREVARQVINLAPINLGKFGLPLVKGTKLASLEFTGISFVDMLLIAGKLPDGLDLLPDFSLVAGQPELLVAGAYSGQMEAHNANGQAYQFLVSIELTDPPKSVVVLPELNLGPVVLPVNDGDKLGELQLGGKTIDTYNLVQGKFPDGVNLTVDGVIYVEVAKAVVVGTWNFVIQIYTKDGTEFEATVNVAFEDAKLVGITAVDINLGSISLPQVRYAQLGTMTNLMKNVAGYQTISGTMPDWIKLNLTGEIKVSAPSRMFPSTFDFVVVASDAKGLQETYRIRGSLK